MAQGCWSVVSVCATSYSWTTGPHWGAMESPQTAAGTRDPATPMVAVPAENGSTNLAGVRSPGIGSDGRLVQMSAKIPLRGCEPLVFRRWVANFKDCASKAKLNGLLQNRAVPTREAVVLSFPSQSDEQQQALYEDARSQVWRLGSARVLRTGLASYHAKDGLGHVQARADDRDHHLLRPPSAPKRPSRRTVCSLPGRPDVESS